MFVYVYMHREREGDVEIMMTIIHVRIWTRTTYECMCAMRGHMLVVWIALVNACAFTVPCKFQVSRRASCRCLTWYWNRLIWIDASASISIPCSPFNDCEDSHGYFSWHSQQGCKHCCWLWLCLAKVGAATRWLVCAQLAGQVALLHYGRDVDMAAVKDAATCKPQATDTSLEATRHTRKRDRVILLDVACRCLCVAILRSAVKMKYPLILMKARGQQDHCMCCL